MRFHYSAPILTRKPKPITDATMSDAWNEFANGDDLVHAVVALEEREIDGVWFVYNELTDSRVAGPFETLEETVKWIRELKIIRGRN